MATKAYAYVNIWPYICNNTSKRLTHWKWDQWIPLLSQLSLWNESKIPNGSLLSLLLVWISCTMPEISGSGGPGASSKLTPVPNPSPVIHSHQHGPGGQNPEGWHSACRRQRTACSARSLSTIMDEILARSLKQKEVIRSEVDAFVPVAPRIPVSIQV
jgi:hypothetical protein